MRERLPAEGAIVTNGLVKRYGDLTALDGLDLNVPEGTVLGLLGPNGAGKTTAVRILTTLLPADGGSAWVAGIDVAADPDEVRRRIGLSGQYAAVDEYLTGTENLEMIGRLYHMGKAPSRERAIELIERFELDEAADRPVKTYSGGMRRRLDLAGALVAKPAVLFLDEPTTGLDPAGRADMWDVIRELVGPGHHPAAHHPVHGGGRPARRRDRGHRPRPVHRAGHRRRAEAAGAVRERIELVVSQAADIPEAPSGSWPAYSLNGVQVDERSRQADGAGAGWRRHPATGFCVDLDDLEHRAVRRRACAGPPSTTCSSASPATPPSGRGDTDEAAVDAESAHEHEEVLR